MAEGDLTLISHDQSGSSASQRTGLAWPRVALAVTATAAIVVLIDQATKALMVDWIGPGEAVNRREIGGPWLAFEYVENTGAAFGMFAGRTWLLSMLALAIATGFVLAFRRELPTSWPLRLSIGLVVGGGLGNLLDRVRLGYVVDYIAVGIWPRFNMADSAITIGLVMLAITVVRGESNGENGA